MFIETLVDHIVSEVNKKSQRKLVGLQLELSWCDRVSNSHNAPIGKRTNFTRDPGFPSGFPGWSGRAWARYLKDGDGFASDPFSGTGLHTGTGGFGSYNGPWESLAHSVFKNRSRLWPTVSKYSQVEPQIYSWDCRVFAEDFPEIHNEFTMDRSLEILEGTPRDHQPIYKHLWEDPAQKQRDLELLTFIKESQSEVCV